MDQLRAITARAAALPSQPLDLPPETEIERIAVGAFANAKSIAVCKSNLQPDFNVRVFECFDTIASAVLRELAEINRFVQKSAESTSI